MKKKILFWSVFLIIILYIFGIVFNFYKKLPAPNVVSAPVAVITSTESQKTENKTLPTQAPPKIEVRNSTSSASKVNTNIEANTDIQISLVAGSSTYARSVPLGSTAYDAMKIFSEATTFRFNAKYYSGLGYFVDEINVLDLHSILVRHKGITLKALIH